MTLFKSKSARAGISFLVLMSLVLLLGPWAMALSVEERAVVNESYVLESQGQASRAIEKMVTLLKAHPTDYFINYRLGWLFSLDKKYRNAADHYQKAGDILKTSLEPWIALSSLYINLGDYSKAARASRELLKRHANNYFGMLRLNLSLLKQKEYSEALDGVNQALSLYPSDAIFLEQRASILQQMGRLDEARVAVAHLLLISPKNEFARAFLSSR